MRRRAIVKGEPLRRRRAMGTVPGRATVTAEPRMRRRETATLVALIDAVVAPEPPLPPVRETDATAAFRARFSGLDRPRRLAVLRGLERRTATRGAAEALRSAASVTYYGDEGVLRALGHDPAERVREARERRLREVAA